MLKGLVSVWLLSLCIVGSAAGQEEPAGITVPITVTGNVLATNAKQTDDGLERSATVGFHLVASPTLRLSRHWFLYSALDVHSASFYAGSLGVYEDNAVSFDVRQAFLGYSANLGGASLLFKAGQLSSAFGRAPLDYDDARMPLLGPPTIYAAEIVIRPDQLACGVADLLAQRTGMDVDLNCGGSQTDSYGITPLTLYGIPGIEAQLSGWGADLRVQVTNSSPVNPQSLISGSQFATATVGAGYTLRNGLHLGFSEFRGPYLDSSLVPVLPTGRSISSFRATGWGADVEWSRGGWSTQGEWQRFHFDVPGFTVSPSVDAGYAQLKKILSPRVFVAARIDIEHFGSVTDSGLISAAHFQPNRTTFEAAIAYRLNRNQLLKIGCRTGSNGLPNSDPQQLSKTIEMQLVTDFTALSRAFR